MGTKEIEVTEYASERLGALLPWPGLDAHKYSRGKLVLVAGSASYPGAACLAARAAQRAGAGYVEVLCAPESVSVVRACGPSLVVRSWEGQLMRSLPAPTDGRPLACVVGPGFDGADKRCAGLTLDAVRGASAPLVADGGALAALATADGILAARDRADAGLALVITPHMGEAARLARAAHEADARDEGGKGDKPCAGACGVKEGDAGYLRDFPAYAGKAQDGACGSGAGLFSGPPSLARELSLAYGAVVILKGPDTYISDGAQVVAMRRGTPALAKAGTGDVLAGVVGALLAQGIAPLDACVLGSTLHAEAGRLAAAELTDICVVPEDVIAYLPQAVRVVGQL